MKNGKCLQRWLAAVGAAGMMLGCSGCSLLHFAFDLAGKGLDTALNVAEQGDFVNPAPSMTPEEVEAEYLEYIAPADDEIDFRYANDYQYYELVQLMRGRDACSYGPILGMEEQVTQEELRLVVEANDGISREYKDFIHAYVTDWLNLYPESDFRVFYHNLQTLRIRVVEEDEMMLETVSTDSAACYLRQENEILLLDGADFSKGTDNYIILTHELTHCARSASFTGEDGIDRRIGFYDYYLLGTYAEEGIITDIAYQLEGLGSRAQFYPLQSNCYRIIMECTGYDGADFMNHSVNYLMDMMDEFMGDEQYAWYIVALIDAHGSERYTPYQDVDYTNYQDLYDYMTRMYMKKYLLPEMTAEEAEQVYQDFLANIMFRFETMIRPYDITEENFRPAFELCLAELGIG